MGMLVLTRHESESIRIGDEVYVTVLKHEGNRVKLGFQAPPEVNIVRTEIDAIEPTPEMHTRRMLYQRIRAMSDDERSALLASLGRVAA